MGKIKVLTSEYPTIVSLYRNGTNTYSIASLFNVRDCTISRILKKCGTKIRDMSQQQRKYNLNENFFERIDTEQKAYWLGFIVADGCVLQLKKSTSSLQITLNIKDKKHLEKFKKDIKAESPIKETNYKWQEARIVLSSIRMCQDLSKYGVVPRKTFKTYFPENIPDNLKRHFIRGYFDGDGCITHSYASYDKNKQFKCLSISIRGTLKLLSVIQEKFIKNCNVNKTKIITNGNIYTLLYSGNIQVPRLLDYLYKDSNIYLDRKYHRYLEINENEK